MASPFTELSLTAQTAYAQLLDASVSAWGLRGVSDLPGSFASKTVKGRVYWYFQYTEPAGRLRQVYVGPDGEALHALMARQREAHAGQGLGAFARSAVALGCSELLPRHLRVVLRLAEYGFFSAGGVLVGTHAFIAYANMLGVRWGDASRTQDLDFAHAGKNLAIALPGNFRMNTDAAIQSLGMGLLPIAGLSGKAGATYLNPREPEFRLDFLTPLHRGGDAPYPHAPLGVTLQPLKFMEFSLEHVQQAVLLSGDQTVLVNVPHPARYALHKLIVYGERSGSYAAKANKDLAQAGMLLARLGELRRWEVDEAWADLVSRGKGWTERAIRGRDALERQQPRLGVKAWLVV